VLLSSVSVDGLDYYRYFDINFYNIYCILVNAYILLCASELLLNFVIIFTNSTFIFVDIALLLSSLRKCYEFPFCYFVFVSFLQSCSLLVCPWAVELACK
jgi:hypothetical protein